MTDKMGTIHRAPTLGKIKKDIDSHFHGNDRKESGNDREDKTGLMNRTATLGKMGKEEKG